MKVLFQTKVLDIKLKTMIFGDQLNGVTFGLFNMEHQIQMTLQNIEMKLHTLLGKMLTQVTFKILLLDGTQLTQLSYNLIGMKIILLMKTMSKMKAKPIRLLDQALDLHPIHRNIIQEVKIYFSPDKGGLPLCRYGNPAGQITILPVLGFTLFEKCKNSVSPPSSTSFK